MLKIITYFKELDFAQILKVYDESIIRYGDDHYPKEPPGVRIVLSQRDFYESWKEFFCDNAAVCALWAPGGVYCSVLRLDKYRDGLLLNTLETAPAARGKGHAKLLISSVIQWLRLVNVKMLYSHIDNKNDASIAVHLSCGFKKVLDHAVYLDGSVLHSSSTYLFEIK